MEKEELKQAILELLEKDKMFREDVAFNLRFEIEKEIDKQKRIDSEDGEYREK